MKRLSARALALCLAALFLLSLPHALFAAPPPDDVLVVAKRIDDVISLDPAEVFEFSGAEIIANIYDRLVVFDPEDVTRLYGGAAESWEVSADGRTFRFKIRPGMRFHSGNPVTAEDAAWSLRRVIRLNKSPSFILGQFGLTRQNVADKIYVEGGAADDGDIDDGDIDDGDILVIELDKPYAPTFLLYCLTSGIGSVLDRRVVLAHEEDGDLGHRWLKRHSAGSGPFVLKSWRANEYAILDRWPGYWGGAPIMRRLVFQHIAEPATQRLMLEKGDVDVARDLTSDQADGLKTDPTIRLRHVPKGMMLYLGLNQKNPVLADPRVTQALKYLVDYQGIAAHIVRDKGVIHQTIIPSGLFGALDETPYGFDPARARALLAEAGYGDGFDLTLDTRHGSPNIEIAQALQAGFAQAGIRLEILTGDDKQVLTKYRARNHDIFLGEWGVDYKDPHSNADAFAVNTDNGPDALFRTLAWRNSWADAGLTALTGAAILERDAKTREAMYRDIQGRMLATSPFVILFQGVDLVAERRDVRDIIWGPSFDSNFYRFATKGGAMRPEKGAGP